MTTSVLSVGSAGDGPLMLVVLAAAGLGSALLLGLGLAAFARRRSRSYLLVVLALAALLARSLVAAGAEAGVLSTAVHHLAEHGLDVVVAALVVGAVVYVRTVEPDQGRARSEVEPDGGVVDDDETEDGVEPGGGDRP